MNFALKLKTARERLGLTQAEAALVVDMSAEWVSKCERGLTVPPAISREGALERLRVAKKRGTHRPNAAISDANERKINMTNTKTTQAASGTYQERCVSCEQRFWGKKNALECPTCREKSDEWWDALTDEQQ